MRTLAKSITMVALLESQKHQFDRKGFTLATPDYLADQDPLRK